MAGLKLGNYVIGIQTTYKSERAVEIVITVLLPDVNIKCGCTEDAFVYSL